MYNTIEILILIAFFIRTLRNIFYHLFLWDIKEYRFDRMYVHLSETYQGKTWLLSPLSIIKWLLLFTFSDFSFYLVNIVFILEAIKNIFELKKGWKMPPLKLRSLAIFFASFIFLGFFVLVTKPFLNIAFSLLIVDKLLGFTIAFLVLLSNLVFFLHKKIKISNATNKIKNAKHLKIIGITGSYGKTTTKELSAQLLATKYKVLKTLGSQNTDIGIAELILSSDISKYDYFVCEMAAYKRGEIAEICKLLKGKIEVGVITGINEQHQSLFGSLENTQIAKFELIEAINSGGVAIFNGKSRYIEKMIGWAKEKNIKVIVDKAQISNLPTLTQNLSLAKNVAKVVGISEDEIKRGIEKAQLPEKTMNIIKKRNLYLIDNSFNSNPDGVYAALEYLRTFKGPKVLVLQPLIELGKYSGEIHKKIGKMSSQICDQIVLTNKNFNSFIMEGAPSKISVGKLPAVTHGTILFQGKEAEKFLKSI